MRKYDTMEFDLGYLADMSVLELGEKDLQIIAAECKWVRISDIVNIKNIKKTDSIFTPDSYHGEEQIEPDSIEFHFEVVRAGCENDRYLLTITNNGDFMLYFLNEEEGAVLIPIRYQINAFYTMHNILIEKYNLREDKNVLARIEWT